jgi:hypothetical protein
VSGILRYLREIYLITEIIHKEFDAAGHLIVTEKVTRKITVSTYCFLSRTGGLIESEESSLSCRQVTNPLEIFQILGHHIAKAK